MEVVFHFLACVVYLFIAGYGLTRLLLRNHPLKPYFILVNGFCLSIILFSEAYFFFSPKSSFTATVLAITTLSGLFFYGEAKQTPSRSWFQRVKKRNRQIVTARAALCGVALFIVLLISWSFLQAGWNGFWGSANEDIFDGLNGRDAFVEGNAQDLPRFLDPLVRYQYSSLAFWSYLFQSFDRMNVFYLQGLLMIFLQVVGVYFLCRKGFLFGHKVSMLCALLGSTSSFYVSTFYTGHEGSVIFGAMIPYLLGLGLYSLQKKRIELGTTAMLVLWIYVVARTYIFPLGFVLIPFVFYACYKLVFSTPEFISAVKNFWNTLNQQYIYGTSLRLSWLLVLVMTMVIIVVGDLGVSYAWSFLEPVRDRALTKYRAWAISHHKEMALIYWGVLPASIPYGSIANPAKLALPALLKIGFGVVAFYLLLILYGLVRLFRESEKTAFFLAVFAACWMIFLLSMKYLVVDSYYLYKFYYTNYFLTAIILGYSANKLYREAFFSSRGLERIKKFFVGFLVFVFLSTNLVYIFLYNLDLSSRPYNKQSEAFEQLDALSSFVSAGVFFNLPRFDYHDIVRYQFKRQKFPPPTAVIPSYSYELEVKGVKDVINSGQDQRTTVWENDVYRLLKVPETNKIIVSTFYEGERHPFVYNGFPFRWVRDNANLTLINPSQETQFLSFYAEPGPGLNFRPFHLVAFINGSPFDSVKVKGLQNVIFRLPRLENGVNTIELVNRQSGRNFMPWEERYINYRIALVSLTSQHIDPEALRLMNVEHDIVPPTTWAALNNHHGSALDTANLLCVWNNWGLLEEYGGKRFRWVNNDAQLLLLNPTRENSFLNLELERGPALAQHEVTFSVIASDSIIFQNPLVGYHRWKIELPTMLREENIITLAVDKDGEPLANDPRILNFRVFRIYLSQNTLSTTR